MKTKWCFWIYISWTFIFSLLCVFVLLLSEKPALKGNSGKEAYGYISAVKHIWGRMPDWRPDAPRVFCGFPLLTSCGLIVWTERFSPCFCISIIGKGRQHSELLRLCSGMEIFCLIPFTIFPCNLPIVINKQYPKKKKVLS